VSGEVWTARIVSKDPDRFDVTRKSGGAAGTVFAPSWAILSPALAARKEAQRLLTGIPLYQAAALVERNAWESYVPAFMAEMRGSYKAHRAAWESLLARDRVVLVCYCTDPHRCHRTLLARDILSTLGATYRGEVSP
jgi:hypothetical protein